MASTRLVVGLTGGIGSGKSTVAGLLAAHLEPHLSVERPGEIADEPRKRADSVREWPHPADDHLMVEPA
jgi:cytidylate kinase